MDSNNNLTNKGGISNSPIILNTSVSQNRPGYKTLNYLLFKKFFIDLQFISNSISIAYTFTTTPTKN